MKRVINILMFLTLLLNLSESLAQEKSRSYSREDVSSEIESNINSAKGYLDTDPQQSFGYVENSLTLSLENRDKNGEAQSYQILGQINYNLSQYDLAIDYYLKAITTFLMINNEHELNQTYWLLAEAYQQNNQPELSLEYYEKYQKFVKRRRGEDEQVKVKDRIADVYRDMGENEQALKMYNEVLEVQTTQNNAPAAIATQNKIGEVYYDANQDEDAYVNYQKSAEQAKKLDDKAALSNTLQKQSKVLRRSGRYKEELEVRQERLELNEEMADVPAQAEDNLEIGNIYIEQEKTEEAIPYIEKSIVLADQAGDLEQKGKAIQTLSNAYSLKQEYNKALDVYKEYVELTDAIYKQREAEILASMQITTTLNKKIQRLDLIEKDLELSQKTVLLMQEEELIREKELKAQRIFSYSMLLALLIMTTASFFIYRTSVQKRKANQLLALRSLRSQMNPHFIYNSLNSVNNYISRNDERAANRYLSEFSRLMRQVMENSKHDFVPLASEIDILKLYLSLEHSRFSDKFDYTFDVADDLDVENYEIPPMMVQPYIENAIWHGLRYKKEKGMLKVLITKYNDHLKVVVEDNGIGRKKSKELKTKYQKETESTGMRNIRTRLKIISDLHKMNMDVVVEDIQNEGDTGTRVSIKVPHKNTKE